VDVEAPAGVIEKALSVTINRYQVGSASYFSNDRDPAIPAHLAGTVQAVLGLNNLEVMHSASHNIKELAHPDYSPGPAYTVGSRLQGDAIAKKSQATASQKSGVKPKSYFGWYAPSDLYADYAYDYQGLQNLGHCCNPLNNPNNSPPESSIAIAIWDDFLDSDFYTFATISQPVMAYNVQRYYVDGFPTCCGMETTLDVEWSTAMSNSFLSIATTAQIHVYEGTNGQNSTVLDVINRILTDGHARVLSMSWGGAENYLADGHTMDSYHAVFNQMVGQGWTLVAASGDGGATDDCADHLSVDFPPSDPDVTAAGGTSLVEAQFYGWFESEVGWTGGPFGCANNDGGGGGGCSAYYAAPDYQANQACGAASRSVPDLALNADGVYTPQLFVYEGSPTPGGAPALSRRRLRAFTPRRMPTCSTCRVLWAIPAAVPCQRPALPWVTPTITFTTKGSTNARPIIPSMTLRPGATATTLPSNTA
jgi:subtilase family serine protease